MNSSQKSMGPTKGKWTNYWLSLCSIAIGAGQVFRAISPLMADFVTLCYVTLDSVAQCYIRGILGATRVQIKRSRKAYHGYPTHSCR